MKGLQELVTLSGTSLLSKAEANKIILMVASWRFLTQFLEEFSLLIMWLTCFSRILFCSSCWSDCREIVVFKSPSAARFV